MAVIINEFEVITEAPQTTQQPAAQRPAQGQLQVDSITPHTISRLLHHKKKRAARVCAY